MNTLRYLAYGSNLHPVRLLERVPSARLVGVTRIAGYALAFHKRGRDGSGKCSLAGAPDPVHSVFGAIYEIDASEKQALDTAEGKGIGYRETWLTASHNGTGHLCFSYLAQRSHIVERLKPYHWYREMVVLGAMYHGLPDEYVRAIQTIDSDPDPDPERHRTNELLLRRMRAFSPSHGPRPGY